eukprot:2653763-Rhodomonas_salina.1
MTTLHDHTVRRTPETFTAGSSQCVSCAAECQWRGRVDDCGELKPHSSHDGVGSNPTVTTYPWVPEVPGYLRRRG